MKDKPAMYQQMYSLEVQMTYEGFWEAVKEYRGGWHMFPTDYGLLLVGVSPFMVNGFYSWLTQSGAPAVKIRQEHFIAGNKEKLAWCPKCEKPHEVG